MTTIELHPFNHLGPAPYKFVGRFQMPSKLLIDKNPSAYNMALSSLPKIISGYGSCAHCGTAIKNVYIIECSNSNRYGVGCDCIFKIDSDPVLVNKVKRAKAAADKEAQKASKKTKLEDALAWFEDNRLSLARIRHPQEWLASQGKTYADYIDWCLARCSDSSKIIWIKRAMEMLKEVSK